MGRIVNECRNLIRAAGVHLRDDPATLDRLTTWTALFPWAAMSTLRGELNLGPAENRLSTDERTVMRSAQHPALHNAQQMTMSLDDARRAGVTSDMLHALLDYNVHLLVGYLGGCERIRKTPLPFAYVVHLRRALVLYGVTLPFSLVEPLG